MGLLGFAGGVEVLAVGDGTEGMRNRLMSGRQLVLEGSAHVAASGDVETILVTKKRFKQSKLG